MSSERKQGKHVPAIPGQREQSQACPGRQRRRAEADQESGDGDAIEHEPETEKSPKAKHRCLERIFHFKEQVIAGWHFQTTGRLVRWLKCSGQLRRDPVLRRRLKNKLASRRSFGCEHPRNQSEPIVSKKFALMCNELSD